MREYGSPAAFRAAVDAKLRHQARRLHAPAFVVRRQAALERLLARLAVVAPNRWALKGGMALETRLGESARASVDLDADHVHGAEAARADLQRAAIEDVHDHFEFAIVGAEELHEAGVGLAIRYRLESSVASQVFEPLQIDVTIAPAEPWDAQPAQRRGLLADLGFEPVPVLLVPLERQVAEKLHAYTRTYRGRATTRARDLVDLLLIRQHGKVDTTAMRDTIQRVFRLRSTHAVPEQLPDPPRDLATSYRREAEPVAVVADLNEAHALLAGWLNPVLAAIHRLENT